MDKKIYSDEVEAELDTYIAEGDDKPQPSVIEEMAKIIGGDYYLDRPWEEYPPSAKEMFRKLAQSLYDMVAEDMAREGMVKLSADQSLPICPYQPIADMQWEKKIAYEEAQQDMLRAGFRRIEG